MSQIIVSKELKNFISLESIRFLVEKIIEILPNHFESFQNDDQYRIFFQKNHTRHKSRIAFFQRQVIWVLADFFGKRIDWDDIALIFHMDDAKQIGQMIRFQKKRTVQCQESFKKHGFKIIRNNKRKVFGRYDHTHVEMEIVLDDRQWTGLIPKEFLIFSDILLKNIAIVFDEPITTEAITSPCRKYCLILARMIFVTLFLEQFPNTPQFFFMSIFKKKKHETIGNIYHQIDIFLDHVNTESETTFEFITLLEKVRERVQKKRPFPRRSFLYRCKK